MLYNQEGFMLYSFSLCEFLLEGFSHKVFDEATCAIQNAVDMYSFLQEPFFPTGFSGGVLDEAYAFVVIAQGGVL
jgi:hypothetical protein